MSATSKRCLVIVNHKPIVNLMLHHWIKEFLIEPVSNLLLPAQCIVCSLPLQSSEKVVCALCWDNMPRISQAQIDSIKEEIAPAYFDELHIQYQFSEGFQRLAHYLKYRRHTIIARLFAEALSHTQSIHEMGYDLIAAVPLHPVRRRERGYNQSALIAGYLADELNIPFQNALIKRVRNTKSQTNLNRSQRMKNVKHAFSVDGKVTGQSVLIVDDVITTGSTLNACAHVLKNSGSTYVGIAAMGAPVGFLQKDLEEKTERLQVL